MSSPSTTSATQTPEVTQTSGPPKRPHVAVLGAGPAGVTAALSLARDTGARVTVFERGPVPGGNAGSFKLDGVWCDHGSHRLHPAAGARVLDEVRSLLGEDLLWRPRHGRIHLQNRWIHFPLKPIDLLFSLPKTFAASLALDTMRKPFSRPPSGDRNFSTVLRHGLGQTICESFYYPYVEKLWGVAPDQLSVTLAERRVSGSSVSKILRKVARQIPGVGSETAGGFHYPRRGFGQISEKLCEAAENHGARFVFGANVTGITRRDGRVTGVRYEMNGEGREEAADTVWSTLPISVMVRMLDPAPPAEVLAASGRIRFRGMILIYMVLEQSQFTEYDAHYFPERSIPISRMSEPKNYSNSKEPRNRTILCAELPADPGQREWDLSDEDLGRLFRTWLADVGLPVTAPVVRVLTRRLRHAYPVYDRDYETQFGTMDEWLTGMDGLLTFGRQGLFAHDNTHHAMTMAFAAADCFGADGRFDWDRWSGYRAEFRSHVVED